MAILQGNRDQGGYIRITRYPYFIREGCTAKNDDQIMKLTLLPGSGVEIVQGVLDVEISRGSGYPFTSTLWGGAEDMACRINAYNSAANTSSYGGIKGCRIYTRQYSGGQIANMYGAEISVDERGSGASPTVATAVTAVIAMRINGVCSTASNPLVVEDNSQGSITVTTCTGTAMLKIRSTQPVATGARATGIHFETTGSGTGWTHAFSFQTATGLEGFTSIADGTQGGNVQGYIKVYDVAGTQTLYIPCYDAAPA